MIVNGNLYLGLCRNLISLGKLKKVGSTLVCPDEIKDLGDLEYINDNLYLTNCYNLKSLGKLKEVRGRIYLNNSGITEEYMKENYPHLLDKCMWGI